MSKQQASAFVWPRPQQMRVSSGKLSIEKGLLLTTAGEARWLNAAAKSAARLLNRAAGKPIVATGGRTSLAKLTVTTMDALPANVKAKAVRKAEGYVLSVGARGITLAGADAAGVFYGAQTLVQLLQPSAKLAVPAVTVRDWPKFPIRGAHLYMPSRKNMKFFWEFLDFLAAYKCNTIFLEVGGGLEYDKHPKINAAWRKFCKEAKAYDPTKEKPARGMSKPTRFTPGHSKGANALQASRYFKKDSTHTELAGGDCLTKDEARKILSECKKRHIEVVPEMQSFSHSYYLCLAYPEIAERRDDPWPDTYCPLNPKSYEILFDVMDEVIDVFKPRMMHIGHDELYTIGICPKCRKRTGHELLTHEVTKVHDFLAGRGVRTMMWGDKLMNITTKDGLRKGGVEMTRWDPVARKRWRQPATWKAVKRLPNDIMICDWYWRLDPRSERNFAKNGFEEIFGNFEPIEFPRWQDRSASKNVLGAEMSSWSEVSAYAFTHSGILHRFFPGSDMLWRGLQMPRPQVAALMARHLTPVIDRMTRQNRWLVSGEGKTRSVDISSAAGKLPKSLSGKLKSAERIATVLDTGGFKALTAGGKIDKAIVLDKSYPKSAPVKIGQTAKKLLILQGTTMQGVFYQPTYYSYHRGPAELLKFRVKYKDGKSVTFTAHYGEEIGQVKGYWPSGRLKGAGPIEVARVQETYCFAAVPVEIGTDHTLYAQEWTNPRPRAIIESVTIRLGPDATDKGEVLVAAMSTAT